MTDPALCKHLLNALNDLHGSSLPEDALVVEWEARAGRPLTTAAARDALAFCREQGWIGHRFDNFNRPVYWLKDAGLNQLRGA